MSALDTTPQVVQETGPSTQELPTAAPTVMPEVESPLTKAFTEKERASVKELITELPLIFEAAFKDLKDEASVNEAVDIWGVPLGEVALQPISLQTL